MTISRKQPDRTHLLEKSRILLGWPLVQRALAGYTCSPATSNLCSLLVPADDLESANTTLNTTAEMVEVLISGNPFPINPFNDVEPTLSEAREQKILEPEQCLDVLKLLRVVRDVHRVLGKLADSPLLKILGGRLDPLPSFLKELGRCIDDEGEIKENASPELKQAIRDVWAAKQKLEAKIGKLLSNSDYKDAVQDNYHTEREGRLVIPIKVDRRSQIDGIVHDSSGSGQTLYMEPSSIVPLNNQLKIYKLKVDHEKVKILQLLAGQMVEHSDVLASNLEVLVELDLVHARAKLARTMEARMCSLEADGEVRLEKARNPELILNGRDVVPNDIAWNASTRVIIISGPNTGGKTVTLKTVGLMALMARAGLFLPVGKGSQIPFFPEVYADIGDDQNIELNLSTFSAHLEKIIHITDHAVSGSLILLDELGIATDPQEGASLAEAILTELNEKGVTTLVSTHYLALKLLAQTRNGFLNACTEFDSKSLAPTYRLIFGVPGHSAALDTAERLGLHRGIIKRAREIYRSQDTRADAALKDLTHQRLDLIRKQEVLETGNRELEQLAREQRLLTERLREKEKKIDSEKSSRVQSAVREAKNQVRQMIKEAKGTHDTHKLRKIERQLESMGRVPLSTYRKDLADWEVPPEQLQEGDVVLVESYGTTGTLLENTTSKKKVRVRLGNVETVVEVCQLKGNTKRKRATEERFKHVEVKVHATSARQAKTTCDLRGMSSDEALATMEAFLSQAVVNNIGRATIIHGHGMGTIKSLVRDYLSTSGMCKNFSPAPRTEGGDGATIVEF